MPRDPDPDVKLEVALKECASRLASENVPMREAVAQLEVMAGGRADLLAAAAGQTLGEYVSRPGSHPKARYAVALLLQAGADGDLLVEHVYRANRPDPRATNEDLNEAAPTAQDER